MLNRVFFTAGVLVLAVWSQPLAVRSADADPAAAMIARHRAFVGWGLGDGTLKSVRLTVERTAPSPAPTPKPGETPDPLGEAHADSVEVRRDLLYRATTTAYGIDVGSRGFTGSVFWRANENGQTVTRRGRDAREGLTEDVIDAEGLSEVPASARPDARFDDKPAAVVRIEPKTGVPADLFLDRESGALLGYRIEPDDPVERSTVHVVSYAEFAPGKRYVSAWRFGDSRATYRIAKFEPNAAVSDADLHPPAPRPRWSFGTPRTAPVNFRRYIGMFMSGSREIDVDATVNGHLGHFLFDSGAGSTLIYDPFAKTAGVKDIGRSSYSGVNGRSVRATLARVDSLAIAGSTLHDVIVQHSAYPFGKIDGIIGYDVLAGAVVHMDLVHNRVTIDDPATFAMELVPGAYEFNVDLSEFHAGVPMKIGDRVLSSVWLDTGDDYFLMLPRDYAKGAVPVPNMHEFSFVGADGEAGESAHCGRLHDAQVGPYRYQDAISCFVPNSIFGLDGGLIGFDFLRHFNWTFDYPHGKVVLTPNGL